MVGVRKGVRDIISGDEYINITAAERNSGYTKQTILAHVHRHAGGNIDYKCCGDKIIVMKNGKEFYTLNYRKKNLPRIFVHKS